MTQQKAPSIWELRRRHRELHPDSMFLQPAWLNLRGDSMANFHILKRPQIRGQQVVWVVTRVRPVRDGSQDRIYVNIDTLEVIHAADGS